MTGEVVEFSQWARKLKSDDYCRERALRFRRAELLAERLFSGDRPPVWATPQFRSRMRDPADEKVD